MTQRLVAIVGAGPAGLFAAGELAKAGCAVVLINRDIKPSGLVEYGVFPTKHKFKNGLRKQFRKTFQHGSVHYRGHVSVGTSKEQLSLEDIDAIGFDAVVLAVGAQGTKFLGLVGEEGEGVYHAKDLVYHYNRLPPFSNRTFAIGKRVIIIGVGNVMVDLVHWLDTFIDHSVEAVALSRTVPRFRKWGDKELKNIRTTIDVESMTAEVDRLRDELVACGEEPDSDLKTIFKYAVPQEERSATTRWWVKWLAQPSAIALDEDGRCKWVMIQNLRPEARPDGGRPKVHPVGEPELFEADNVIMAIGDAVDARLGLLADSWGFKTMEGLDEDGGDRYRTLNQAGDGPSKNIFAVGWAREASIGLVGNARKDALVGVKSVLAFLETQSAATESVDARLESLDAKLRAMGLSIVDHDHILELETHEQSRNPEGDDPLEGKLSTNQEMLDVIHGGT